MQVIGERSTTEASVFFLVKEEIYYNMGTSAASAEQAQWREAKLPIILTYSERVGDEGIDATYAVDVTFACEAAADGRCTINALGGTSLETVVEMIQDHTDVHFPATEVAAAKASLQAPAQIPDPRPDTVPQAAIVV